MSRSRKRHDIPGISFLLGALILICSFETALIARIYLSGTIPSFGWGRNKASRESPRQPLSTEPGEPMRSHRGALSIIVDDNGYRPQDCRIIRELIHVFNVAVLPNLPHSSTLAECAYQAGKEVLIHLPLEPHQLTENYSPHSLLTTQMSPGQIKKLFRIHQQSVPHAVGVNNHMGSKATEDAIFMTALLDLLKEENLFFVDSRVTSATRAYEAAQKVSIPFEQRDIFLDNQDDPDEIRRQFARLRRRAEEGGYAIGIIHARPLSWKILQEEMSHSARQGFQFIPVSEGIKRFQRFPTAGQKKPTHANSRYRNIL